MSAKKGASAGKPAAKRPGSDHGHADCPLLRVVADAAPMSVIMLNAKGDVTLWNDCSRRMFGWEAEEVLGRFPPFLPESMQADFWEHFNAILRGGRFSDLERRVLTKAGGQIDVSIAGAPIRDERGEIVATVGILQDITGRKRLEREFLQAQKMEAVGRLAGGVAHDFNNLLTAICGYSALLLQSMKEDDPNRIDVLEIKKAGERAAGLTRQLLAFSRQQVLQAKVLDCNEVIEGLEKMLRRLIGEDVRLETVLQRGLGRVRADPGQLEQVLMNLAVNSRDAMPRGGTVTLRTREVEIGEDGNQLFPGAAPGRYVQLTVADTGCGMDAATQARLFEPFFTTKEQGKGTGLGLATVYGIVKQSGGCIYVDSAPGRGSAFHVLLPRLDAPAQAQAAADAAPPRRGTETVLLVEDDGLVSRLVRRVLSEGGYTVLAARSAEEALDLCARHEGDIRLMLTDIVMPGLNGRELAKRAARVRPAMRVVYMSGYTDQAVVKEVLEDPGARFLQKPLTAEGILRAVREVLDQRRGTP